jgi:3'-phosphoadenosine 5'-phosphosulfate sulfotransferase (PAPS reductase)/FAD synthetase
MKKTPFKKYEKETGAYGIVATMACESRTRKTDWMLHGCNAFDKERPLSQPISFWTEQDVLQYIKEYAVKFCSVYGEIKEDKKGRLYTSGCKRTGCIFCMFGCHREKAPNRFQQLKETHPAIYHYCMKPMSEGGLGLDEVLTFIGVDH